VLKPGTRLHAVEPSPDLDRSAFAKLNNEILTVFRGSWSRPPAMPQGWEGSLKLSHLDRRARAFVHEELQSGRTTIWRDVRAVFTLPFWRQIVPEVHPVLCFRHPVAVAHVLKRDHGMAFHESLALWLAYAAAAVGNTRGNSRMFVFWEDIEPAPAPAPGSQGPGEGPDRTAADRALPNGARGHERRPETPAAERNRAGEAASAEAPDLAIAAGAIYHLFRQWAALQALRAPRREATRRSPPPWGRWRSNWSSAAPWFS
jgi:hypothetical protein